MGCAKLIPRRKSGRIAAAAVLEAITAPFIAACALGEAIAASTNPKSNQNEKDRNSITGGMLAGTTEVICDILGKKDDDQYYVPVLELS